MSRAALSIHAVYRIAIWMPVLVPALLIALATASDFRLLADGLVFEVLAYSLMYGGIPYTLLAVWGTFWVGGRPEPEIRRLMFRAPLLMMALFASMALVTGVIVGDTRPFAALALLGAIVSIPLGYAYVGLAVVLRHWLGPQGETGH
jgi:hypothetical protein